MDNNILTAADGTQMKIGQIVKLKEGPEVAEKWRGREGRISGIIGQDFYCWLVDFGGASLPVPVFNGQLEVFNG